MPSARKRPRTATDLEGIQWEDAPLGELARSITAEVTSLQRLGASVFSGELSLGQHNSGSSARAGWEHCPESDAPRSGLRGRAERLGLERCPRFSLEDVAAQLTGDAVRAAPRLDLPNFSKMQRQQARRLYRLWCLNGTARYLCTHLAVTALSVKSVKTMTTLPALHSEQTEAALLPDFEVSSTEAVQSGGAAGALTALRCCTGCDNARGRGAACTHQGDTDWGKARQLTRAPRARRRWRPWRRCTAMRRARAGGGGSRCSAASAPHPHRCRPMPRRRWAASLLLTATSKARWYLFCMTHSLERATCGEAGGAARGAERGGRAAERGAARGDGRRAGRRRGARRAPRVHKLPERALGSLSGACLPVRAVDVQVAGRADASPCVAHDPARPAILRDLQTCATRNRAHHLRALTQCGALLTCSAGRRLGREGGAGASARAGQPRRPAAAEPGLAGGGGPGARRAGPHRACAAAPGPGPARPGELSAAPAMLQGLPAHVRRNPRAECKCCISRSKCLYSAALSWWGLLCAACWCNVCIYLVC